MSSTKNIVSILLVFIVSIIIIIGMFVLIHNGIVEKEEKVFGSWSQVESNYQRRADLIPNLVKTVKGFMKQEREVLVSVIKERGSESNMEKALEELIANYETATSLSEGAKEKLDDEEFMSLLSSAQQNVGQSLFRLLGLVENYPQLRSAEHVLALQYQLEGTENRINVARMRFNDRVTEFNGSIRKMPASLIASMGGFQRKAYFKSDEGSEKAVDITF